MSKKTFQEFIDTIKESNIIPSFYYTDYIRVAEHLASFKEVVTSIGVVNSSAEFVLKFKKIYNKDNDVISVTPLFTGVRPDKPLVLKEDQPAKKFNKENVSFDEAIEFLDEVGFLERVDENFPLDLRSYFFGVNVGLDSNGRKNRSGKQMERVVGSYIKPVTGEFLEQPTIKHVNDKWGTEFISPFKKNKKFDFVIKKENSFFFIETNFFNTGGSKTDINNRFVLLNNQMQDMINPLKKKIVFVVITDGVGLTKAMTEIEDVFEKIKHVYNIDDLNKGIIEKMINDPSFDL